MEAKNDQLKELGIMLVDIGALLMSSGASTARTRNTINRISETFGYQTDMFITHRAIMLTVHDEANEYTFSCVKRTSPHGVNFRIVSGISRMSWKVMEEAWNIIKIRKEINRLINLSHYPRWLVLIMISLAGSSFCHIFGGGILEMLITFIATFFGLVVRQESVKINFNPYLCVFFASLVSSLIAGLSVKLNIGINPELAFTASVLFLIPGVPLINMFSDIIDGNLMNGLIRGINGLTISFAIALGLLSAIKLYQL
jgi:uncharacterized membrane protein YjjP (DUF1212 family)